VEIPAPVSTTMRLASPIHRRTASAVVFMETE